MPDALLAAALRAQDDGVLIARQGRAADRLEIIFANENFCAMTGYTADALTGRAPGFLHADKAEAKKIVRWHAGAPQGRPLAGEGFLLRKDGTSIHAAWNFSVIPTARHRAAHIVGTYRDTTEKRRLQEALVHAQRLDAVGRLAGGVAHDFNNLLSVITGYCQILAGQVMGQPQLLKEVEEIHQAGLKAAALTRQLLAFGRRQPLKIRVLNLNRFVTANADILARLLGEAGRLELDLDPTVGQVRVDPTQFQQVLLNLTLNARDALRREGLVTISTGHRTIKTGRNRRLTDAPPGTYACLTVADNGTGMSAATQEQLFEPFFTTKPEGKGSGLGLSLVHGIVQQSGGFITVKSELSAGSTFEIFLPETNLREDPLDRRSSVEPLPSTLGHEVVLLVEEDDVVRKMVTGILTADGYRVVATKTPATALRESRQLRAPVQLLIANLGGGGEDLARALQATEPKFRVLSTSTRENDTPLAGLKRNRWAHLPKPYALSELLKAARSLLDA
ncbi:MAG: sensor hybrid histidine kinase [Verrucomicrobia bacterium]|nr:sensor hybrid histidine kinase [Verrucomicrobiota bacterium]